MGMNKRINSPTATGIFIHLFISYVKTSKLLRLWSSPCTWSREISIAVISIESWRRTIRKSVACTVEITATATARWLGMTRSYIAALQRYSSHTDAGNREIFYYTQTNGISWMVHHRNAAGITTEQVFHRVSIARREIAKIITISWYQYSTWNTISTFLKAIS